MKKLLLAFFLFGFVLVNAQNKDTFLLKQEKWFWEMCRSGDANEKMEEDTAFSLVVKAGDHYFILDTLFTNDTLRLISVQRTMSGSANSYLFCSKFGKKPKYIGKMDLVIDGVTNAYYNNATLIVFIRQAIDDNCSFYAQNTYYSLFKREKGIFEEKVNLYSERDKCNAYKSNLISPFVLDIYLLNKDAPLRYFIDIEGKKIMRADLDYYEEQYFPFVNGKIALEIK